MLLLQISTATMPLLRWGKIVVTVAVVGTMVAVETAAEEAVAVESVIIVEAVAGAVAVTKGAKASVAGVEIPQILLSAID
jgi:hypothetical protein